MPWTMSIWPANKSGPPRLVTNLDVLKGIDDGFAWTLSPHGGCVKLVLRAMNQRLRLGPLDIVQLTINGTPWYYGTVPEPSHIEQPDVEEQVVLGGREILRRALMDGKVYRNAGVYAIVRDILGRLCPPGVTYSAALIGDGTGTDTGPTLATFYSPTATLLDTLTGLAKSAGCIWDVDVLGRVFFRPANAAPLTVPYAGQRWQRLRVQGADACTQAVLRIASAPSLPGDGQLSPGYLPRTVTATATHADHALYGASQAVEPPEGVSVVRSQSLPPTVYTQLVGGTPPPVQTPENVSDGNPDSYAVVPIGYGWAVLLEQFAGRCVGFRMTYEVPQYNAASAWDLAVLVRRGANIDAQVNLSTTNGRTTITAIVPPDASMDGATWPTTVGLETSVYANPPTPTISMWIYELTLLVVDDDAAQRVAESYLQPPYYQPTEVELRGLVPPRPQLTVTGSPDGDVTGETGAWEYQYTLDQYGVTLARLGSDGQDDEARAIRLAIRRGA